MSSITTADIKDKIVSALVDILKETIRDITKNSYVDINYSPVPLNDLETVPTVVVHYFYDEKKNKLFLEYTISNTFRNYSVSLEQFGKYINKAINKDFKYYTVIDKSDECYPGCWPEILLMEDGYADKCDTSYSLTPYTVGYWASLLGKYIYIEDRSQIEADFMKYMPPSESPHKFEDFIKATNKIQAQYSQTVLTKEQQASYINEYMQIASTYKDDEYYEKMAELNTKYKITVNINSKIPEAFGKYKNEYKKFFNNTLTDIANSTEYLYCYFKNFDTKF